MGEISPFASAFAAAEGTPFSQSPPATVVGFSIDERSTSVGLDAPRPQLCGMSERQGSLGGLNQLFRAASLQHEAEPPRPRLLISTARSLRTVTTSRVRRVARIEEHEPGGGGGDGLGTTAPSNQPLLQHGLVRATSRNIDTPARLSKAQTAPEGLPDSLVLAAMNAGPGHCHSPPGPSGAAAGGPAGPAAPSQHQRHRSGLQGPTRSGSNESASSVASGRPPMPVTPAFAPARSGSGSGAQQQQQRGVPTAHRSGSYRELFDAQTELSMAQAQVSGLQEALRRKNEELDSLQQKFSRVRAERDDLRHEASAAATGSSSASAGSAVAAAGGSGHGASPGRRRCAPGAPAAPAGLRLAHKGSGGPGLRRGSGGGVPIQPARVPAAVPAGAPGAYEPGGDVAPQPALVSAFATHALPFSFE
ncbi:hypothetical protein ABPG75_010153 [Micractinium tetrahymenae]